MRRLVVFIFIAFLKPARAQTWDFGTQIFANRYLKPWPEPSLLGEFKPGSGVGYGFTVRRQQRHDSTVHLFLRHLEMNLISYNGKIYESHFSGHSGSETLDVTYKITTIGITIYPINIDFFKKRMEISLGANFQYLIFGKLKGTYSYPFTHYDSAHGSVFGYKTDYFNNGPSRYIQKYTVGLVFSTSLNQLEWHKIFWKPEFHVRFSFSDIANSYALTQQIGLSLFISKKSN